MESSQSTPQPITQPTHISKPKVPATLPEEITAYYKLHQPPCGSLQSARVHLDPMLLSPSSKAIHPEEERHDFSTMLHLEAQCVRFVSFNLKGKK